MESGLAKRRVLRRASAGARLLPLLLVAASVSAADAGAQEPLARAFFEPAEVELGQEFRLVIEVSGVTELEGVSLPTYFEFAGREAFRPMPSATELRAAEAGQPGGSVTFEYSFVANIPGSFEVGPLQIVADGRSLETDPATLVVNAPGGSEAGVRARLSRSQVNVMDEFELMIDFVDVDVADIEAVLEQATLPDMSDFARWSGSSSRGGSLALRLVALTPGSHEIGPVRIQAGEQSYETEPLTMVVTDAPPTVEASVSFSSEVWAGSDFLLVVEVVGVEELDEDPILPDLSGFAEFVGPSGSGSSYGSSNGRYEHRLNRRYKFRAVTPGEFEVGPVRIVAAGRTIMTEPVRLVIGESPPEPVVAPEDLLFTATADKARVYVNEPVVVTYRTLSRGGGPSFFGGWTAEYDSIALPSLGGFRVENLWSRRERLDRVSVNGRRYQPGPERRVALFPLEAGETIIGPGTLEVQIHSGVQRGMGRPSSRAERAGSWAPMTLATDPIPLEVVPLPIEGRPESFRGRVGRLEVVSWVDRTEAEVGDTVTLRLEFSGEGQMRALPDPEIEFPAGFRVSEPQIRQAIPRNESGGLRQTRTYIYKLTVNTAGSYEIPAVEVSYFDVESESYGTSSTEPFKLTVR